MSVDGMKVKCINDGASGGCNYYTYMVPINICRVQLLSTSEHLPS
jgi:hypothetical protein